MQKLRGMFAFAIVDLEKKMFFVARDQLGIKPLVYYFDGEQFVFASELNAFKEIKGFDNALDLSSIDDYLYFQYIPAPKTVYKHCHKLLPGHYITATFDLNISPQTRYYEFDFSKKLDLSFEEATEQLDAVLLDSVEKHMQADVEYGAFLSGGIDSTIVVDYMTRVRKTPINTYAISFENDPNSDLPYANKAAEILHTNHHVFHVKPDALEILPNVVQQFGEPFGDASAVPCYYVSKLAASDVKMVLSGDGGDEFFAGYGSYQAWIQMNLNKPGLKRRILNLLMRKNNKPALDEWILLIQYFSTQNRNSLWKEEFKSHFYSEPLCFTEPYKIAKKFSTINKVQYMDINTYLHNDILTKVDITGMMHSLELRTPITDRVVLEFASQLPEEYNVGEIDGYGLQGKLILKKMMEKKYSKDFVYRKKRGFSMPLSNWFKNENEYHKIVSDMLLNPSSEIAKLFNVSEINRVANSDHQGQIWLLLVLEQWLRKNKINL